MTRIPVTSDAEIIAASFIVEVVVEAAKLPVLKTHAREASAAGNGRCHHLEHHAHAPFLVAQMIDFVADAKIKPFAFGCRQRSFAPAMKMFQRQVDIGRA